MDQREKRDPEGMKAAIEAIRNREMGSYRTSRVFTVPQTALEHYVKEWQKSLSETVKTKLGRKQVLLSVFSWKESFLARQWQT